MESIEGAIDSLTRWGATGWAWMPGAPERAVEVEAVLDGRVIGRALADQVRPDLADQGKGPGRCGFVLTFAEDMTSGVMLLLQARGPNGLVRLFGDEWSSVAGYVDTTTSWGAVGWAWMPDAPERAVEVEAVLDGRVIGRALADQMRADLAASGRGSGRYGFTLQFTAPLIGDAVPEFRVPQPSGATKLRSSETITATISPPNVRHVQETTTSSLNVEGAIDSLTRWGATGWAWMPGAPERAVEVEAVLDGRVIGRALADQVRPDLADQGKGPGRCGFVLTFAEDMTSGVMLLLQARGPNGLVRLFGDEWSSVAGYVDTTTSWGAVGWAWMPDAPERAVEVEAVLDGRVIGRALADQMRADLAASGRGSGRYGFTLQFTAPLIGDAVPEFRVPQPSGATKLRSSETITATISPPNVRHVQETTTSSLNVEGAIDSLTRWGATGWAWMPGAPERAVEVEAVLDGRVIGHALADQVRPDLADQGKGLGRCGFVLAFSEPSPPHANFFPMIRIKVAEGYTVLPLPEHPVSELIPGNIVYPQVHPTKSEVEGAIDRISQFEAIGWAWMPETPDQVVEVEAVLDGRVIGRVVADQMRPDLCDYKLGTGFYGFRLPFVSSIFRENLPTITATGLSTRIQLPPPSILIFPEEVKQPRPDTQHINLRSEGSIDLLTRWYAAGWAWLPHNPKQSVQIEAVLEGKVIGRAIADQMRPDLATHGKGTGLYGFKLKFDAPLAGDEVPEFRTLAAIGFPLTGALHLPPVTSAEKNVCSVGTIHNLLEDHSRFTSRGPKFEEVDNTILSQISTNALSHTLPPLLVAFYLPQFHPIAENDRFWGHGFTEWRQLTRGFPRFAGHYQPRTPRDLGFYNLLDFEVLRKQCKLALTHGIGAFAYYYYWFNRRRVLEKPLEAHLASDIEMPFLLIWANENWTRTWDGSESDILLEQDYKLEDDDALVEDLVRHFRDPRYVRLSGRPLLIIYNPKNIPDSIVTIQRWREAIAKRINVEPLIFMAQTFGEEDPHPHGLDGALEFPPHKLTNHLPGRPTPDAYSPDFAGRVIAYDDLVKASLDEEEPEVYPLIKTAVPSWDNDSRRPNRGLTLENIDPIKYQRWMTELITRAIDSPVIGTPIVAINAWNEWAESAYLEPDVYYGAAFLNATARAYVTAVNGRTIIAAEDTISFGAQPRVSVILPNYNHARFLPERIRSVLDQTVPPDEIIFLDDCSSDDSIEIARSLLETSSIPYRIVVNEKNSGGVFRQWIKGLSLARYDLIWVAETDDSADRRFLSNILPTFAREDVMMAFGRITCIDPDGASRNDLDSYFDQMENFSWNYSCVVPAFNAFSRDFAIRNVIPNASGLVFRKPVLTDKEKIRFVQYHFAGDWYFYALVARGGAIAYSPRARSFFRINPASASRSSFFTNRHLTEHMMVIEDLRAHYGIDDITIEAHSDTLAQYLPERAPGELRQEFHDRVRENSEPQAMRVCIAANGFAVGGGEILPIDLANALKARGLHVTYLVVERPKDARGNAVRKRLRADIPVVYWDDVCDNFIGFLKKYGIQLLNSHNVSFDYRIFLRNLDLKIPYVASMHGGFETVKELLTESFLAFLARTVSKWLYLSEKNLAFLPKNLRDPAKLVHSFNAVVPYEAEWVERRAFRSAQAIPDDAFVFVQCSRAIESKGWRTSIEIVESLSSRVPRPMHLVLIGDGPAIEGLKERYGNSSLVTFLGHVDRPMRYFRCFDMGIFPSRFEGETFPLFLLECFKAGLPVATTDIGEIPRIMDGDLNEAPGIIVNHLSNAETLTTETVTKLRHMLDTEGLYDIYRTAAFKNSQRFSMTNLADLYVKSFLILTGSEYLTTTSSYLSNDM